MTALILSGISIDFHSEDMEEKTSFPSPVSVPEDSALQVKVMLFLVTHPTAHVIAKRSSYCTGDL